MKIDFAFDQKPEDAIKAFTAKGNKLSWDWHEVYQEAHTKAFTVAKVTKLDILLDIRNAMLRAIEEGITFHEFRKTLEPLLKAKGWWGIDKDTGALLGSPWRLRTIFQNNLNSLYAAGRYKQMTENTDHRPYWQYWAILDSRTRDEHRDLHGLVFRYDDVFWDYFYPPNGWHCRCKVRALTAKDLQRKGLEVISAEGKIKMVDRLVSESTGLTKKVALYKNPITGLPVSPAPGWSYNVGKSTWKPDLETLPEDFRDIFTNDRSIPSI